MEHETLGGASAFLRVVLCVCGVAAVAVVPLVGALVVRRHHHWVFCQAKGDGALVLTKEILRENGYFSLKKWPTWRDEAEHVASTSLYTLENTTVKSMVF